MPSTLLQQDSFNIEELRSAWSKSIEISQAVVISGGEIILWDRYLLAAYDVFRSMDDFALFQFEDSDGQVTFQVSPQMIPNQCATLISKPTIRKAETPLSLFFTLQADCCQSYYDSEKLESIANLYKRFVLDALRWPLFVLQYVANPQEYQKKENLPGVALLDRFTSPLDLYQN